MSLRSAADTIVDFNTSDASDARDGAAGGARNDTGSYPHMTRIVESSVAGSGAGNGAGNGDGVVSDGVQARTPQPGAALQAGAARISGSRIKRGLDLGFAVLGLLFTLPFLLALSLLIRLETPGPALFKQRRTGRNGATFTIYKFRTMRVVEDGVEIVQAAENDHRTTRFGRFLRRSSIDELPQLLNVLRGEMSLIGPRPHALAHDAYYGSCVAGYEARFLVRPGLSGLAQVRGCRGATPETEMMAARVRWDLTYIETWTLGLEVRIFLETIRVFFFHPAPF